MQYDNYQSVKLLNNESNIGRAKVAGYKLPGHTTQAERRNFFPGMTTIVL